MSGDALEKAREVAAAMRAQGAHAEAWGAATVANYLNLGFIGEPMPKEDLYRLGCIVGSALTGWAQAIADRSQKQCDACGKILTRVYTKSGNDSRPFCNVDCARWT